MLISRWAELPHRALLNLSIDSQVILSIALAALVATFAIIPSLGRVFIHEFQEKLLVNSMMLFLNVSGYDESGKHGTLQVAPG